MSEVKARPAIKLRNVKSSAVRAIGYDPESKTLAVHFSGGGLYHYGGVEPDVHADMLAAKSMGGFVAARLKGKFPAVKQ